MINHIFFLLQQAKSIHSKRTIYDESVPCAFVLVSLCTFDSFGSTLNSSNGLACNFKAHVLFSIRALESDIESARSIDKQREINLFEY